MACRVDLDMPVLEGINVLANWAMDIGGVVGGGSGNKAGEVEEINGAVTGSRGGSGAVTGAQGRQQWQLSEPPPLSSLVSWTSLLRDVLVRLLLSSSPSLSPLLSPG